MNKIKVLRILSLGLITAQISACGEPYIKVNLNKLGSNISIHTEKQNQYINDAYDSFIKYANGVDESSRPNPIKLVYKTKSNQKTIQYKIKVWEKEEAENVWSFTTNKTSFDLYNCKINTTYNWQVIASNGTIEQESEIGEFTTENSIIRNIYIDGVTNVRDIGGFVTSSGKIVKQGLIYRSAAFNDSTTALTTPVSYITETGKGTVIEQLKIKTEIDLRKVENNEIGGLTNKSVISDEINYVQLPMIYEGKDVLLNNKENVKALFEMFADSNNYPINFHCTWGRDRTGAIAFALEALLGVKEEDIYKDYFFSQFSSQKGYIFSKDAINKLHFKFIKDYEGDSLQEKAYNLLKNEEGISEETLNQIIDNLLE